jgi:hypothetical protein
MATAPKTRWSFAEERLLMKLAASGESLDGIARTIQRTPETVRRMAKRLGVSLKAKPKG